MAENERTQRIDVDSSEQEPTRRLAVYEEQDRTQRLQVAPTPPWDSEDPAPASPPGWEPDERPRQSRGWPTTLVVIFSLVGILVGVLGTLVLTNGTRSDVQALESRLADAQQALTDRDTHISELERQLEDARSRPGIQLPPGVELPPGMDLPNIQLPDEEQRRALAEAIQERIRDFLSDR